MILWHETGLNFSEVRNCYIIDRASNLFASVKRIIDLSSTGKYNGTLTQLGIPEFTTATNGAVIVDSTYLNWKFIAPDGFSVTRGSTAADFFTNLNTACAAVPVEAWETFAKWFGESGAAKMNAFLTEGGEITITDCLGNTYTGTQHRCGSVESFPDFLDWVKSWCGPDFLEAASSAIYATNTTVTWSFSMAAMGMSGTLTFTFRL